MPHFSEWAAKEKPSVAKLEVAYLVDNGHLHSKSSGICYRKSPALADKATKLAHFGSVVRGVPHGADWLEVGDLFLPMCVDGAEVLLRVGADEGAQNGEEYFDAERREEEVSHLPAWLVREAGIGDKIKKAEGGTAKALRPAEIMEDTRQGRAPTNNSVGEWYEVVAERAVIRSQPSVNAHIENIKNSGEFVELFEWDWSKEWRRCKDSWQAGWMLINHMQFGQILEPVNDALLPAVKPMCEAVMTNDLGRLRTWLAEVPQRDFRRLGPAALTMAAARGYLDLFMILLEAGVHPQHILAAGANHPGFREPLATHALARAVSGLSFVMRDFDMALAMMQPAQQTLAEQLVDQVAEHQRSHLSADTRRPAGGEDSEEERPAPRAQEQPKQQEPTAPQEPAPLDEAEGDLAQVIARRVAVRAEPVVVSNIISEFRQGDCAVLLEHDATLKWRKVRTKDTDQYGWTLVVHESLGDLWKLLDKQAVPKETKSPKRGDEDWDEVFGS